MLDARANRLTWFSLGLIVLGMGVLSAWAWQGLEVDRQADTKRIRHFEELAAYQVVNNLGLELFHMSFTFSVGLREGRSVESVLRQYRGQAHYPDLLQDVYLVTRSGDSLSWRRWTGTWVPEAQPAWARTAPMFDERTEPSISLESPTMSWPVPGTDEAVVVRYSVKEVLDHIVPTLVQQAFGSGMGQEYAALVFRQQRGTNLLDPSADLIVPLVPEMRLSDWLANYLDRAGGPLPEPMAFRSVEDWARSAATARWAIAVTLKPAGIAAFDEAAAWSNLGLAALLFLLVGGGLGLFLFSVRRLLRAAGRERAFTTLVSHELRTPLAAIRSLSENLERGVVDGGRAREYGTELLAQSDRLGELVGNMLLLARLQAGVRLPLEVFDAAEVLSKTAQRHGLSCECATGSWLVLGHRATAAAALDNLVTNALRYGFHEPDAPRVELFLRRSMRRSVGWIGLAVSDDGPGLTATERRQLFLPYQRGRAARERQTPGGGIGLSLVKAVMAHLKGRVQVSPPGRGLTVVLWLREAREA